jgi:hypothetical protein
VNAGVAVRLQNGLAVGAVRLAAAPVGLHTVGWQQRDLEASPEVRRGARPNHYAAGRAGAPELLEVGTREALPLADGAARPATAIWNTFLAKSTAIVTVDKGGLFSFECSGGLTISKVLVREESIPLIELTSLRDSVKLLAARCIAARPLKVLDGLAA